MNFKKKTLLLIVLGTLLRIGVAVSLELGNDEVYYQTYAQHLQWNYFDHPPMIALMIRLSTFNLFFNNEFFIRLGPILFAALGTWLIFLIGRHLINPRAGWIAAILYNTSFYSSILAGTFILPDSPQVLFWLLSAGLMIRILNGSSGTSQRRIDFILLGISIGLCILSKIHGVFLWLGFGAYLMFHRRDLLLSPMLWISVAITAVVVSPIYWWNLNNHFITYAYHQGRIHFWGQQPDPDHLLQQVLGSVFYNNPVNFILYIIVIIALLKGKIKNPPRLAPLLLWLSIPLITVLLWTSLFNETLPHWSGPAYFSLMILAGGWLDEKTDTLRVKWLRSSAWVYILVVLPALPAIQYLPFRIGSHDDRTLGKGDITLDMTGWKNFSRQMDSLARYDFKSNGMNAKSALISDYWFPAGHLDHYYAQPYHQNLLAIGPLNDIHHFAWLNQLRPRLKKGDDAYFIYASNYYGPPTAALRNLFTQVDDSIRLPQYRNGMPVRYFIVYRLHDFRGDSLSYLIPGIR